MEPNWPPEPKFVPIPSDFYSLENDGPFNKCLKCEAELLQSGTPYLIERVFVQQEPIVEYAMCEACVMASQSELSAESRQAVTDYMLSNLDVSQRLGRLSEWAEQDSDDASELMNRCLFSGTRAEDCREKQIAAWCQGDQMRVDHVFPMMISGVAIEELNGVLSEKTRGWIDDFVGDNFGMPPEFCDNPDFRPVLI
ncbi:MAG: hypothetical protein O2945_03860 [Planctomycetota bacterium]|nr:hypothetical protein [Planctomycetota bacterium]MDA0918192.1 hypothetical protein [Planctomycetota bacterium]